MTNEQAQELLEGIVALELSEEQRIAMDHAYMRQKQADPFRQAEADRLTHEETFLRIMLKEAI